VHISPEIGYLLRSDLAIAGVVRLGFPLGANLPGHATLAPAGLLRLRYGLGRTLDGFQLVGSLGGGFIRHTVHVPEAPDGMDVDTNVSGPFILGPGVAYWHSIGSGLLKLVAELHTLAGIPAGFKFGTCPGDSCIDPNFSLQFDFDLGVSFSF
jgi:hypothetical protein